MPSWSSAAVWATRIAGRPVRHVADDVRHVRRDVDELARLRRQRLLEPLAPVHLDRALEHVAAALDAAVQVRPRRGARR